jgi:hypothetical protein
MSAEPSPQYGSVRADSTGMPWERTKPSATRPAADAEDRLRAQQHAGEVGGVVGAQLVEQAEHLEHGERPQARIDPPRRRALGVSTEQVFQSDFGVASWIGVARRP